MKEQISANSAFCLCCGDRINLSNGGQVVQYCRLHRTQEARNKHKADQAALEREREAAAAVA